MLAGLTVLKLKKSLPELLLVLVLPCRDQTKRWSRVEAASYEYIRTQADEEIILSESYYPGCMHKRNRYLVDHSDVCIAYLSQPSGGTAYTVDYARRKGMPVINLAKTTV